jgi:hypothetical protein
MIEKYPENLVKLFCNVINTTLKFRNNFAIGI